MTVVMSLTSILIQSIFEKKNHNGLGVDQYIVSEFLLCGSLICYQRGKGSIV